MKMDRLTLMLTGRSDSKSVRQMGSSETEIANANESNALSSPHSRMRRRSLAWHCYRLIPTLYELFV